MLYQLDDDNLWFPDPNDAEGQETFYPGLLALGGDLSPQRLLEAYKRGIFPWFNDGEPILWWSLDPRMILKPHEFRLSKSLQRLVNSHKFEVRIDTCFDDVIRHCASTPRNGQDGTWITPDMIEAFSELHRLGLAHSFETFRNGQLVGGLYGVSWGGFFSGESMFHLEHDASKVAFARMVQYALIHGFGFIDAQQPTAHLASLGAKPIPRSEFLQLLHPYSTTPELDIENLLSHRFLPSWRQHTAVLSLGGNQGDMQHTIATACNLLNREVGNLTNLSPLYSSEPWGFDHPVPPFTNCCLVLDTDLSPQQLISATLSIESRLGRIRHSPSSHTSSHSYSSRPIDIDILFYDNLSLSTDRLQIPHPRLHLRRFVLQPLADIIPHFSHPTLHTSVATLLSQCPDHGQVLPL